MNTLIVYGTTEGQTAKICEFIRARLAAEGHSVSAVDARHAPAAIGGQFDAVILAASVHAGHYQAPLIAFAHKHAARLNAMPSAFVSVSLSAAGDDEKDWKGLRECVERFERETGWIPAEVHHAAGAFRFSEYDFFKRYALKLIARQHGQPSDHDYELTDYQALAAFTDSFVVRAGQLALEPQGR
ncbi:MAG TPA: flavodoxin domain-containing protein [Phenylobacterium sp.]